MKGYQFTNGSGILVPDPMATVTLGVIRIIRVMVPTCLDLLILARRSITSSDLRS